MEFVFHVDTKNIMGKEEHFTLSTQCFQRPSSAGIFKLQIMWIGFTIKQDVFVKH